MDRQVQRPLDLGQTYPCPVCHHGTIHELLLTDAFTCDFCRHILSADVKLQQVQVVDSSQSITWGWDGLRWRIVHGNRSSEVSGLVLFTAAVLTILPASLIGISAFIFPTAPSTAPLGFSTLWALITLVSHLGLVLWLLGEYYQIPFYVATKARLLRRRFSQRS